MEAANPFALPKQRSPYPRQFRKSPDSGPEKSRYQDSPSPYEKLKNPEYNPEEDERMEEEEYAEEAFEDDETIHKSKMKNESH